MSAAVLCTTCGNERLDTQAQFFEHLGADHYLIIPGDVQPAWWDQDRDLEEER